MSETSLRDLKAVSTVKKNAKPQSMSELSQFLASRMGQIKSVIANKLTPEKMARVALNELRTNKYLADIAMQNPGSFVNSVVQASHLGLEIGGTLGQAFLVPFKGEVKMMPGYRGLISLARRSGEISSITAQVVYEKDEFDLELGLETKVRHKPNLNGDRGDPKLVYMVAHFKDGGSHFEWMTVTEVMKIKARSSAVKSGKETPWDTDRDEMIKKTVIRRGWKYLPMSIEMRDAEMIENAVEHGKSIVIDEDGSVVVDESTGEIIEEEKKPEPKQVTQDKPEIKSEDIQVKNDEPTDEEKELIRQRLIDEANADRYASEERANRSNRSTFNLE